MNYNDVLNWSNLSHFIKHFVNEMEIASAVFALTILPVPLQNMCAALQEMRMQTIQYSLGCQSGFLTS